MIDYENYTFYNTLIDECCWTQEEKEVLTRIVTRYVENTPKPKVERTWADKVSAQIVQKINHFNRTGEF